MNSESAANVIAITKTSVAWHGLVVAVARALDGWRSGPMTSERECQKALHMHLSSMIPNDCHVEREYRHAGTTADLRLAWQGYVQSDDLFFELKHDLVDKGECDRLVGQIKCLQPSSNKIIVALFGTTSPALLWRLRQHSREYTSELDPTMAIVTFSE